MAKLLVPVEKIEAYLEAIRNDYRRFNRSAYSSVAEGSVTSRMEAEFCLGLGYKVLNKYIKVTTRDGESVHSFIVNSTEDRFSLGTILKAAGWKGPAKNFSRGNVIIGDYRVNWTGTV